jgi:micrococcal nuclease
MSIRNSPINGWMAIMFTFLMVSGCITEQGENEQSWNPKFDTTYEITVISIIDGDTLFIETSQGEQIKIRILGIDTPEINQNDNKPTKYHFITNLSCLSMYGQIAKERITSLLSSGSGYIIFDEKAGKMDIYDRYLCYVYNETMIDIGYLLLNEGLARIYPMETFEKRVNIKGLKKRQGILIPVFGDANELV